MFELIIAICLIALNGVFALSELAVVSARRPRLKAMAEKGRPGARIALKLMEDSGRFLSTVQIGITLVGILAGAFSGAALGARLTLILAENGVPQGVAEPLGFGIVIGLITFFSIVIGELVPKQFALRHPEGVACAVAPLMLLISKVAAPAIWLLNTSTRVIFRLFGGSSEGDNTVTEEEIRMLVGEAESAGVIEEEERRMIGGVLRLGDRQVRALMTPRTNVDWIDLADDADTIRELLDHDAPFPPARQRGRRRQHDRRGAVAGAAGGDPHAARRSTCASTCASRRSFPTRSMPSTPCRSCATPRCRWRSSTTNTAISKGW